jgi:hypothetical protein
MSKLNKTQTNRVKEILTREMNVKINEYKKTLPEISHPAAQKELAKWINNNETAWVRLSVELLETLGGGYLYINDFAVKHCDFQDLVNEFTTEFRRQELLISELTTKLKEHIELTMDEVILSDCDESKELIKKFKELIV